MMLFALGIAVFILGAAADFYTSKRVLVDSTGYKEANPIIRWLMEKEGKRTALAAIKVIVFVLLLLIGVPWWMYAAGGIVYGAVAYRNYRLWQKTS